MKFTEVKNEGLDKHFKVTIPAKDVDGKVKIKIEKLTKTVRMPGFRVGKVPVHLIEKKHGDVVRGDIVAAEMRSAIEKLVEKHGIKSATSPNIDDLKAEVGKDVEFVVKFETMPEIPMPDF